MRRVYRWEGNVEYWDRRWAEVGEDPDNFEDLTIYPIRYAEQVMRGKGRRALELGCGPGRLMKHYRSLGKRIVGLERSEVATAALSRSRLPALHADVMHLPVRDGGIEIALAFGVFHNLEHGLDAALAELARILAPGGKFCISMRPDNLEMRLNELYWRWRNRRGNSEQPRQPASRRFHKLLVTAAEFEGFLGDNELIVEHVERARNLPLAYRIPLFRARRAGTGTESTRRSSGYRLNGLGSLIDGALVRAFPSSFCNALVFIGYRA